MKNKMTFFEKIEQLYKSQGFKNVNDFALNGLGYRSAQKINRLKDENNSPSWEIITDISNKFESLDMNWLIAGVGEMLRQPVSQLSELPRATDNKILAMDNAHMKDMLDTQKRYIAELLESNKKLASSNESLSRANENLSKLVMK